MCPKAESKTLQQRFALVALRWFPAVLGVLYASGIWDADAWVEAAWRAFSSTDFARRPMAEAYVAAFSFAAWIVFFSLADLVPCLQCFRMSGFASDARPAHVAAATVALILPTFAAVGEPFGRAVPLVALVVLLLCMHAAGTIPAVRSHAGMASYALRTYLTFFVYLGAIALFHMVRDPRPAGTGPIALPRLVGEVGFGVVAYDFAFSWLHAGMHWLGPHASDHHQHHQISGFCGRVLALDTVNHGLLDGSLQVVVNILVQNIGIFGGPKHKLSRFIHNVVVTGLLVESHAGYDGFWSTHNLYPGILGGAKRHVAHHTSGKRYYQQFFCYLDDLLFTAAA